MSQGPFLKSYDSKSWARISVGIRVVSMVLSLVVFIATFILVHKLVIEIYGIGQIHKEVIWIILNHSTR